MNATGQFAPPSPITLIGQRMHTMGQEMLRLESLGLLHCSVYRKIDKAHDKLIYKVMAMEPVTLRDAAVLALCVAEQVGFLTGFDVPMEDADSYHRRIEMANASILLALMKVGVRTDDIGPHDAAYEIERHRREPGDRAFEPEPPAVSPDARLLEITEEFFRIKAEGDAKYAELYEADPPGSAEEKAAFDAWDDQRYDRMAEIEIEAEKSDPTTPEGFAAKARLVEYDLLQHHSVDGEPDGSIILAISLCRDLIGRVAV